MLEDKELVEERRKNKIRYIKNYMRDNAKAYTFKFNKKYDQDIIQHLESQTNKQDYIRKLIYDDYIKQKEKK